MSTDSIDDHLARLGDDLAVAGHAVRAAGEFLCGGYRKLHEIEYKGIGDLVSRVDRDADRRIIEILSHHSDVPILSEELNPETGEMDDQWIVDPLDGTNAFLMKAGPQFPSVLIARRKGGITTHAIGYFPLVDDWYYAVRGQGAYRNGKRLVCDSEVRLAEIWVEMNQYGDASYETDFFRQIRNDLRSENGARLVTTSLPYSGVAMQIAACNSSLAAAIHDNQRACVKQEPWDIAAPQLIMEEAGGVFVNPEGNVTDPFAAEPIIVARSQRLASEIVDLASRKSVAKRG